MYLMRLLAKCERLHWESSEEVDWATYSGQDGLYDVVWVTKCAYGECPFSVEHTYWLAAARSV